METDVNSEVPIASFSDLCRLCGEVENECVNVLGEIGLEEDLIAKIENVVQITVGEDDDLPKGICQVCHRKILDFCVFYKQCHDTQEKLLEFFSIESAVWLSERESHLVMEEGDKAVEYCDDEDIYHAEEEFDREDTETGNLSTDHNMETNTESDGEQSGNDGESPELLTAEEAEEEDEEQPEDRGPVSIPIKEEPLSPGYFQVETSPFMEPSCSKVVYVVKNASHMPIQSVVSAVLESTGVKSEQEFAAKHKSAIVKTKAKAMRKIAPTITSLSVPVTVLEEEPSEQILIEPDGTVRIVFSNPGSSSNLGLNLAIPSKSKESDESVCTVNNTDHEYTRPPLLQRIPPSSLPHSPSRSLLKSRLKRARNAVKLSLRTLRPHSFKVKHRGDKPSQGSSKKRRPVDANDPNYQVMMANFNKPVSRQTLKRYGLYTPIKRNANKIDAPYKTVVADYIEKISDTEFRCKICMSAKFRWNYKAEIHILEHMDWRPFVCNVCGKSFTQNQYLRKHVKLHFPDENDFICEICGKGFHRRYYLTYHMDEHFDRTYTCKQCEKQFSNRRKHDEHVRYHHRCHYAICDICGQTMRTTALSRHRRQHFVQPRKRRDRTELATSSDSATCDICGQSFRSVIAREEHQEEHRNPQNPYQCGICSVFFKTRRSLNEHMQNHAVSEDESQVAARILDELTSGAMVTIAS